MSQPDFQRVQDQFCAHLRDPKHQPAPDDVEDRRMEIYRNLFFKNIRNFVRSGFPIIAQIYTEEDFEQLVYDFFSTHHCRTPYFHRIGREFVDYLSKERSEAQDPEFLAELAHYEWMEAEVQNSDAPLPCEADQINPDGNLLEKPLVLSPHAVLCSYHYPVHRIRPESAAELPAKSPTFLLVYRNDQARVQFMELNPAIANLFSHLIDQPDLPAKQHLQNLAQEAAVDPASLAQGAREALELLHSRGIILGTRLNIGKVPTAAA